MGRLIAPRFFSTTLVRLLPGRLVDGMLNSILRSFFLVSLQYEPRAVCGKPPTARGYHVSIIADSRLFVFGGVSPVFVCLLLASSLSDESVQWA